MSELRFVRLGFGADAVDYQEAWQEQRRVHAARFADEIPDTCLLLEHPPVYTAGRRTDGRASARWTAPRSSTSTAAGRSPGTAPASSSATRSSSCRARWTWSPTSAAWRTP